MNNDILPIGMEQMNQIFDIVDDLEISRESIEVDLLPSGEGSVEQLGSGKARIVLPATSELSLWLPKLADTLQGMDLATPGSES